ncbi:MAG: GNAT family N-acetyltransferase [Saprospiraceae bacterium]|nr:GNAT family N-acetyltransferase [Saprospiraceae bacterium]
MKEKISYLEFERSDFVPLLKMAKKLWADFKEDELQHLLEKSTESQKYRIIIAKNPLEESVGFSIFSIRTDYVEGADKSPTGYLEGIFVEPEFRKLGIANKFIQLGEKWCKEKGCSQIGSDTWLTDKESRAFHLKVGFWEEEEVVHFLKNIK